MKFCNYVVLARSTLSPSISVGKRREYIPGRFRQLPYTDVQMPWAQDAQERPASHDTDTSMYDVGSGSDDFAMN